METQSNPLALEIYQEETPNPESWKYNTSIHLLPNYYVEYKTAEECTNSDLAKRLFELPFVKSVFISNNFITITKKSDYEWYEINPEIKENIRAFILSGQKVVSDELLNRAAPQEQKEAETSEEKIKELLEKYVRPAVESDGGVIEFRGFEKGVVSLALKGSCSGCPSSQMTLKGGIEGLLKRMVPEVTEVVAVEE